MKIRILFALSILAILGFNSCTQDDLETNSSIENNFVLEEKIETRNENECCDFTYTIDSTQSFELCCINYFTIINLGDCPLTLYDGDLILALIPAFDTLSHSFFACESYADESGYVVLTISSDNDGGSMECGTIPLSPNCSDPCACDFSIEKNECILTADIGDTCQKPISFFWTYPSGATSTYWGITALYSGEYCLEITDANGCTAQDCITIDDCEDPEPECGEDCVFNIALEDQGNDIQFASFLRIGDDCEEHNLDDFLHGIALVFTNNSNCSDTEAVDLWNANNPNDYIFYTNLAGYTNAVEEAIQDRKGCADAEVTVIINNQGGLEYEITYDCETCEIYFIQAVALNFNVNDDCTEIELPVNLNSAGGFPECGACE